MSQLMCRLAVVGLLAALFGGCGGSEYPSTVPVTGKVTYHDEPVEAATVTLVPVDPAGHSAGGTTNANGQFSVMTYINPGHQPEGAIAGEYRITVSKDEEVEVPEGLDPGQLLVHRLNQPPPKPLLPVAYSRPETTTFEIVVSDTPPEPLKLDLE